jgi:Protein of unknown function (DUF2924)
MSTVKISSAPEVTLAAEIAQLRELDVSTLRARWRVVFRKDAPHHLPRHLLMRVLAYRLQADRLGNLDAEAQRLLDSPTSPEQVSARVIEVRRRKISLRPGTVLTREWKGRMQRVAVMADGFAWNGTTYSSLSRIAFVITGTRWNGPKFFGLRDKPAKGRTQLRRPPQNASAAPSTPCVSDDQGLEQDFNIPTRSPQPPFSVSRKPDFAVRDRGRKNGGVDRTSFGREDDLGE